MRVALLAEGVDRNTTYPKPILEPSAVALLAEGVDRNYAFPTWQDAAAASPSSRRAWIEMRSSPARALCATVALLAEGVDRNL